ncbi:MAG: aspartate kinase [Chlorobi bacterium]|nr:aspartate kinase [Chlorobiota bacterium]
MKVFKFGGGVLKISSDFFQLFNILNEYKDDNLIIVVSALNKVTNKFENLLNAYFSENKFNEELFNIIKSFHFNLAEELFPADYLTEINQKLSDIFREIIHIFSEPLSNNYHFEYDRIVSYGEILSSALIFEFLKSKGLNCQNKDIRKIIITDSVHKEAEINWDKTTNIINQEFSDDTLQLYVTQGFIASDIKGYTTTLGREGSDFTASVLAYAVNSEEVIFWKETDGIYNADPAKTDDFVLLPKLSYKESLEQTFYGAKILHPKTIKPLQNKKIPIFVKSFYEADKRGTQITDISKFSKDYYPGTPIFIIKDNQILISVSTLDFSFISEGNLGNIFTLLSEYRIKVNLMQSSAISFSLCVTNNKYKIPFFIETLKKQFKVLYNNNLQLVTIRHYTTEAINKSIKDREILLSQLSRRTARYVLK